MFEVSRASGTVNRPHALVCVVRNVGRRDAVAHSARPRPKRLGTRSAENERRRVGARASPVGADQPTDHRAITCLQLSIVAAARTSKRGAATESSLAQHPAIIPCGIARSPAVPHRRRTAAGPSRRRRTPPPCGISLPPQPSINAHSRHKPLPRLTSTMSRQFYDRQTKRLDRMVGFTTTNGKYGPCESIRLTIKCARKLTGSQLIVRNSS